MSLLLSSHLRCPVPARTIESDPASGQSIKNSQMMRRATADGRAPGTPKSMKHGAWLPALGPPAYLAGNCKASPHQSSLQPCPPQEEAQVLNSHLKPNSIREVRHCPRRTQKKCDPTTPTHGPYPLSIATATQCPPHSPREPLSATHKGDILKGSQYVTLPSPPVVGEERGPDACTSFSTQQPHKYTHLKYKNGS